MLVQYPSGRVFGIKDLSQPTTESLFESQSRISLQKEIAQVRELQAKPFVISSRYLITANYRMFLQEGDQPRYVQAVVLGRG